MGRKKNMSKGRFYKESLVNSIQIEYNEIKKLKHKLVDAFSFNNDGVMISCGNVKAINQEIKERTVSLNYYLNELNKLKEGR